jgi:TolB-like protein
VAIRTAHEITPEGLKREVDVVREQSITRFTGKKLDRVIMMLLALALCYFAFDKFILDPVEDAELVEETAQQVCSDLLTESYGDRSIAVLPFVNMSSDPEQEYFSDGISGELLNLLSRIPKLRVIPRSSAFSFKGKDIDFPTIAEQLNVAYVLEGSVRKAGNLVRITTQLIEARSDTRLWSETYERQLENIFVIQDEISAGNWKK